MILLNNEEITVSSGEYQYTCNIGVGSAKLQVSVDGRAFMDIPDSSVTSNSVFVIPRICNCKVKAIITGDAEVSLNRIW